MVSTIRAGRIVLLLAMMLCIFQWSSMHEAHADYTVSITGTSVSVTINMIFRQNMSSSFPTYNLVLDGPNASIAQARFSAALSNVTSGIEVSGLRLSSSSSGNVTETNVSFSVIGAATSSQGSQRITMSWKSFSVLGDIRAAGVSLNAVGQYLASSPFLGRQTSSLITWNYFADNKAVTAGQSVQEAASFLIFDFSQLSAPLSSWPARFSPDGGGTLTLNSSVNHNMTATEIINEAGSPVKTRYSAGFSHKVQITSAGFSTVRGDTIFNGSTSLAIGPMLAIAIILPVTGLAAYVVEWRFYGGRGQPSKKRKRQNKS